MACQIALHLVTAVLRERIPVWAGSVYLDRRDCVGHIGINARGGAQETSSTLLWESGFPYGHNQWISVDASIWAAMALILSVESPVNLTGSGHSNQPSPSKTKTDR